MLSSGMTSLLWFVAIVAMIPVALWLLKRTPMGGAGGGGVMRSIAALPLSASQRIVTVEVGHGEDRRWLVLGVTPSNINTLYSVAPFDEPADASAPSNGFSLMLGRLRNGPAAAHAAANGSGLNGSHGGGHGAGLNGG